MVEKNNYSWKKLGVAQVNFTGPHDRPSIYIWKKYNVFYLACVGQTQTKSQSIEYIKIWLISLTTNLPICSIFGLFCPPSLCYVVISFKYLVSLMFETCPCETLSWSLPLCSLVCYIIMVITVIFFCLGLGRVTNINNTLRDSWLSQVFVSKFIQTPNGMVSPM